MADDLIERLRTPFPSWQQGTREYRLAVIEYQKERAEAADRISFLKGEVEKLREAVKAAYREGYEDGWANTNTDLPFDEVAKSGCLFDWEQSSIRSQIKEGV